MTTSHFDYETGTGIGELNVKKKVLVDVTVSCDPPRDVGRWLKNIEDRARSLELWAVEFNTFIRDHRSQDAVSLSVERQYQTQCSHCCNEWEEDSEGPICCNKAQEEWNLEKKRTATEKQDG